MKIKVCLILYFLFFGLCSLYAQTAWKMGLNFSSMRQDDVDYSKNSSALFYQFGLGTRMKTGAPGFRAEFLYEVKGRKMESKNTIITSYGKHTFETEIRDRIPYFNVPMLFTFPVAKGLYLEAGPNLGLRLGGKRMQKSTITFDNQSLGAVFVHNYEETSYRYSNKEVFPNNRKIQEEGEEKKLDRRPLKAYDFGLNFGFQYFLLKKMSISYRYNFGITDVFNNNYLSLSPTNENVDSHRSMEFCLNFYLGN